MIRRYVPNFFAALLAASPAARGQGSAPPPPSQPPPPAAPVTNEELLRRFQAMEQANQKLIEEVQRLARDNKKLNEEVQELSTKVGGEPKGEDAGGGDGKEEAGKAEKEPSHLANPYDASIGPEAEAGPGGARTSIRLLPGAQDAGYRRLGKIPLKSFYDYARDGAGFETQDQEFMFKFRGEAQADARVYAGPPASLTHSGFYLPRTRFYLQGHYTRPIDFQLSFQQGFGGFGVLNAFLNFDYADKKLQFRVGRFKAPFTYGWYKLNNFRFIAPERSMFVGNFGLNRQIGAMVWGAVMDQRVEYAVGVFNGPRNSYQDYNAQKDIVAFLNFRPFGDTQTFLRNLNVGGSVDYGQQDNPINPASLVTNGNGPSSELSPLNAGTNATLAWLSFNNGVKEKGLRELWELHVAYYYAGLSFIGGWGTGVDSFAAKGGSPTAVPVGGWFSEVAYLITGETLNERTVIDPIRRFDLRRGRRGLGAFEPYVRYSELGVGNQVFTAGLADPNVWTNRAQVVDVGMNWYLNRAVKVYLDWEHAMFATPVMIAPGPVLQSTNNLFWLRCQVYF